jgi:HAD superfamily hydrolase (TIGR01509 family)
MFEAVIFDFDGVVLNTEEPEFLAWQQIYKQYGSDLSLNEWQITIGTRKAFDPYSDLKSKTTYELPDIEEIYQKKRTIVTELLESQKPMDGVLEWLKDANEKGLKIGMASSSSQAWLEHHLTRLNIRHYFSAVVGYSTLVRPKPYPDSYLKACEILKVKPQNAFAIEDSTHGIKAAKLAGLKVIAVPHKLTQDTDLSEADLIVDSLAKYSLSQVISLLS